MRYGRRGDKHRQKYLNRALSTRETHTKFSPAHCPLRFGWVVGLLIHVEGTMVYTVVPGFMSSTPRTCCVLASSLQRRPITENGSTNATLNPPVHNGTPWPGRTQRLHNIIDLQYSVSVSGHCDHPSYAHTIPSHSYYI